MITNPPNIVTLLRAHRQFVRTGIAGENLEKAIAISFLKLIGRQDWTQFQATYHLYLQSIPLDLAKAAWGHTQLKTATPSNP